MKASTILLIAAGVGLAVFVLPRVTKMLVPAPAKLPAPAPISVAGRALDPTIAGSPAYEALGGFLGTGVLDFLGGIGSTR